MVRRLYAAALIVGTTACTALARLDAPSLHGTPESSGILVVDPDITVIAAIFGIRSSASPVGGILPRVDGTEQIVEGGSASGVVIFSDLPPGKWQLVMIEANWQAGDYTHLNRYGVPLESVDDFTFDVRAGEPIYVSTKIEDDRRSGSRGVRYQRRTDADGEREAWKSMSDIYAESAWAPVFRKKLGAVGAPAAPDGGR